MTKKKSTPPTIQGIFHMHPRGFGFVQLAEKVFGEKEIFIPKHLTHSAIDSDLVELIVFPSKMEGKKYDGEITAILKRGKHRVAATICSKTKKEAFAYCPAMGSSKLLLAKRKSGPLKVGDHVLLKVDDWGDKLRPPQGEVEEVFGNISDPFSDNLIALEAFGIRKDFSKGALDEAKKFGKKPSSASLKGRLDLTELTTFTVDPTTAKDFDDALSLEKAKDGTYRLGVHIADAAAYVKPNSALDIEALERANSTYFPGICTPMLPKELSENLCSLKEGVIRLTVSVLMTFTPAGDMTDYVIQRSFIKSRRRFTYEEAKEILDKKTKSPHAKNLQEMVELCYLLKSKRQERGAVDFSLHDIAILVDESGDPKKVIKIPYDITHQMVEEFMLKANEIVATHLTKKGKRAIFRIHEEPEKSTMEEFYALARVLGFTLTSKPSPKDIQELFSKAQSSPFAHQLAISFIRSMKLAYYSPDNVGHFGLALEHYCHFTSPIRRYSDLIIQRLLFDEAVDEDAVQTISHHCSEKERISFKAEVFVKTLKKLRLLQKKGPSPIINGYITKVKPFGIIFEEDELMLDGMIPISELGDDYFFYDAHSHQLRGKYTQRRIRLGDKIEIIPATIDLTTLEVDWRIVKDKKSTVPGKRPKRRR